MAPFLVLCLLAVQDPADPLKALLERLEANAAAARGTTVRLHAVTDAFGGDEIVERLCGSGRLEVTPSGALWDESWSVCIGPERRSVTTASVRTLTTAQEHLQFTRILGGFQPGMAGKVLETRPKGATWKACPGLDPWVSRDQARRADGVDPLLLYTLAPGLLRTEAELKIASSDDKAWILECRRKDGDLSISKRLTVRKEDLAFVRAEIEHRSGRWSNRFEFEATGFDATRGLTIPTQGSARFLDWSYLVRWSHRVDPRNPAARERTRADFPEPLFASPGTLDRNAVELSHVLHPADPQPLADLAWGDFPWKRWWSYRYEEDLGRNRWMLEKLWSADPKTVVARDEWLRRQGRPGERPSAAAIEGFEPPLFNGGELLLAAGKPADAEAMARRGLAAAAALGDRLNWTCLLCASLSAQRKSAEATTAWLELLESLEEGDPQSSVLLAEVALGRGLAEGFDAKTLSAKGSGPGVELLRVKIATGEASARAVRAALAVPAARPLLSELIHASPVADADLEKELAALRDVDARMAAAAMRKKAGGDPGEICDAAIALWDEVAYCRPWTWDVWGRPTLRMIQQLRGLGERARATRVASRFVEKCAEGKVPMWLGKYRWGETVRDALLPLLEEGREERFVELVAMSSGLAGRVIPYDRRRREFVLPWKAMIAHLEKSRSPEEARAWVRLATQTLPEDGDRATLFKLALEIAPGDPAIEYASVEAKTNELPAEQRIAFYRRSIAAMKAGTDVNRSGGNYGMVYDRLADTLVKSGKLEEGAATALEMVREYPDVDSMALLNIAWAVGRAGRPDLEKTLTVAAARHNAHLRLFSAQTALERLEPMGETHEAFALCLRTLAIWKTPPANETSDGKFLEDIRRTRDRLAPKVKWEDVLGSWLQQPRPALSKELDPVALQAVKDLNADSVDVRGRAQRILTLLADGAVPHLRETAITGAPEERGRAREILEQIYVDTWK